MRYKFSPSTSVCLVFATLMIVSCRAENTSPVLQVQIEPLRENAAVLGPWVSEQWTGGDTTYAHARKEIDTMLAAGENPAALLAQNRQQSQEDPQNPLALFRWAYSAFKTPSPTYLSQKANRKGLREAFATLPSPHTYNYARMRYLLEPESSQFITMGERMLTYNDNDLDVKDRLVDDYGGLISITDYKGQPFAAKAYHRALQLSQDLTKAAPLLPRYQITLANVYLTASEARNRPEEDRKRDARKAIAVFQEYLRLAPADAEFRPTALGMIKSLQKRAN